MYLFRIAIRRLRLHIGYTLLNVVGLSLGLAACFVTLVYVRYQTSFDRFNEELDNIFLITSESRMFQSVEPSTPLPLAAAIKSEVPEVRTVARWERMGGTIQYKDRVFSDIACTYADPELFGILTLPIVHGTLSTVHTQRDFIVLGESMARKLFGDADPVGETVVVTCVGQTYNLTVSAIMKDMPRTSTCRSDAIGPLHIAEEFAARNWERSLLKLSDAWDIRPVMTYVLLSGRADREEVSRKILEISRHHQDSSRTEIVHHLFPLKDVYFHASTMINSSFPRGNLANVTMYSSAAFLLLCIACVNYLLLTLGRASLRAREVGIKKVFGAGRADLVREMIIEATLVALLALPPAFCLVELALPYLSTLLGASISPAYFHQWQFILVFFAIALFVAGVAGGYVSLYLSRFNPIDTLRSKSVSGQGKVTLRRVLMATQMVIFIGLTFSAITIYKQLRFFQDADMGFTPSHVIVLYPDDEDFGKKFDAFKNELKQAPQVLHVSGSYFVPGTESSTRTTLQRKDNPAQAVIVESLTGDREFVETFGMTMVAGTSFTLMNADNLKNCCILNETAVKELGLSNPIGEEVGGCRIVGVVRDFNMHSFRERIPPMVIRVGTEYVQEIIVRLTPAETTSGITSVEEISRRFNNGKPMEWESFEDRLDRLYSQEHKFASVIGYATGVAILVGCLGIFGMSIFVCQQRVKEIGIRKVLGASLKDIFGMITKEFLALVLASAVVAFPLAQYAVNIWLERFAYHTQPNLWDILLGVGIDMVIVLLTISVQAGRAALANPVTSLRYE